MALQPSSLPEDESGTHSSADAAPSWTETLSRWLIGGPRDVSDPSVYHHVSLIAFLAWVGIGADGLSSSCYGPEEAYRHLHGHEHLAPFLALAVIGTVLLISYCYSSIIEQFPSGGGGYLVASHGLGPAAGVVSGSALLVDYVLTISVSIAAAGDALFGLLPAEWQWAKLLAEGAAVVLLVVLNLRGVKESVEVLLPIFLSFVVCFAILIVGSILLHITRIGPVSGEIVSAIQVDAANPQIGWWGLAALLARAYSLGAGTYTGIEAVSNSMPVMREPRVETGKQTMLYMALSLSFTAGGLMLAYLLLELHPVAGKTMNQVLAEQFVLEVGAPAWLGTGFVYLVMISAAALLFVAAQAGFIDGPRVLANMAHDGWMPRHFGNLSQRLVTHNGILVIGLAALATLLFAQGSVSTLVLMYSINVFVTFSLSMISMLAIWWPKYDDPARGRQLALFGAGAVVCLGILSVTVWEKFSEGGWVTLCVTGAVIGLCLLSHWHYQAVGEQVRAADSLLATAALSSSSESPPPAPDPERPTAVVLVGGYNGLGMHTIGYALRHFPRYFQNFVFVSAGIVDAGSFKGTGAVDELRRSVEGSLDRYCELLRRSGFATEAASEVGTDVVEVLGDVCARVAKRFPRSVFFAGTLFLEDTWWNSLFHNQTCHGLQRELQGHGLPLVIVPLLLDRTYGSTATVRSDAAALTDARGL